MNEDELIKELTDPQVLQQQFMKYLREILSFNKAQFEAALEGESPEYAKYLINLSKMLDKIATEPEHKQILDFILQVNLIYFRMMAESNRKLLSLVSSSHHTQE